MHAALRARLLARFRWAAPGPDTPHLLSDVSGWWREPDTLASLGPALAALAAPAGGGWPPESRPTVVISPEAAGFILGPLVATALGAGFVEAYKNTRTRQIADLLSWQPTGPDHVGRQLHLGVRSRHLTPADRVLLIDDWAETGAQLTALRGIVRQAGATYLGAAVIVDGTPGPVRAALDLRGLLRPEDLDACLP